MLFFTTEYYSILNIIESLWACKFIYDKSFAKSVKDGGNSFSKLKTKIEEVLSCSVFPLPFFFTSIEHQSNEKEILQQTQHDAFVQMSLSGMAERLNLLGESIEDWI